MSDAQNPNSHQDASGSEGGILAALPRSRPQRSSPRRAAARNATATSKAVARADEPGARKQSATPTATPSDGTATAKRPARARAKPARQRASASTKKPRVVNSPVATKKRAPKPSARPAESPAPRQGYEPEEEVELGGTVNPPSGAELVESVADIVGELANSGLAAGGRLLKDAFSLLRRP